MKAITKTEFDVNHRWDHIENEKFQHLSQLALDLTDLLCFGRADQNEPEARRAMSEMISYWLEQGSTNATPKSERIGNYSVTNQDKREISLHGLSIAPGALIILDRAGLRNRNL